MNASRYLAGTWRANLEKSTLPAPAPAALTAEIRQEGPRLAVTIVITMPDGTEHEIEFSGPVDGTEFSNTVSGRQWRSRMQWIGKELLIESHVEAGGRTLYFRDFWFLSEDGRCLTMEHRDDDLRGQVTFLERAGTIRSGW